MIYFVGVFFFAGKIVSVFICMYVNMKTETFNGILIGLSVSGVYIMKFILL